LEQLNLSTTKLQQFQQTINKLETQIKTIEEEKNNLEKNLIAVSLELDETKVCNYCNPGPNFSRLKNYFVILKVKCEERVTKLETEREHLLQQLDRTEKVTPLK
jgi:gamma-glutamylcysteine synthetase